MSALRQAITMDTAGIYPSIPEADYHSSPRIGRSGIMRFLRTPKHYYNDYIANKSRDMSSPAILFGKALHCLILEPDQFKSRYVIAEKVDRRTSAGKEYWAGLEKFKGSREIIDEHQYHEICMARDSVLSDKDASEFIKGASYESSIFWNDKDTDVPCKARPDILHHNMIVDLKTTEDASEDAFRYSIKKYGYHVQAAMQLDGYNAINNTNHNNFVIIAVEKSPPYAVAVYLMHEEAIEKGRILYKSALERFRECLDDNVWASYPIQTISI